MLFLKCCSLYSLLSVLSVNGFLIFLISSAHGYVADSQESGLGGSKNTLERIRRQAAYHEPAENWAGRWFPDKPDTPLSRHRPPLSNIPTSSDDASDSVNEISHLERIKSMLNPNCDDGKTNLTLDWDGSASEYLCFRPRHMRYSPDPSLPTIEKEDLIPVKFVPAHFCMDTEIDYPPGIITFGSHRAAWAEYGEYEYLPKQRWLHNVEHGGIVMLYHPCAHPFLVNQLRKLVTSCLRRHVITPFNELPPERPLALVSWGWSLSLSTVTPEYVIKFIQEHALKGREAIYRDGLYNYKLIRPAKLVSDEEDTRLCPNM